MSNFFLRLYPVFEKQCVIKAASRHREWMKSNPYVFNCLPMNNASTYGWDIVCPETFYVNWNGGTSYKDVTLESSVAFSNFGHGTFTFKVGYTLHTPTDWSMLVGPVPNHDTWFRSFSALIETDELKFPLFVTVQIDKPGTYKIKENTPIARLIPIHMVNVEPEIATEPDEFTDYRIWQLNERLKHQATEQFIEAKNAVPYDSSKLKAQGFYRNIAKCPYVKSSEPVEKS